MRQATFTNQFKKDIKLSQRRHKSMDKLRDVMDLLIASKVLPEKLKDHPLRGNFAHYRECHIESDWLLIYKITVSEICFVRTGTHSDLFG